MNACQVTCNLECVNNMDASDSDPVDAITMALARLRGGRGPRGAWPGRPGGEFRNEMREQFRDEMRERAVAHDHHHDHHSDHHDHGRHHGPWGGGERGPGARFAMAARFRLLEALAAASTPLSVSELAEAIGVDQPRASRLVQAAVATGHVRRDVDPGDARRNTLHLTDAGKAVVDQTKGSRRAGVEAALAEFDETERAQLAALLTRLAEAWPR